MDFRSLWEWAKAQSLKNLNVILRVPFCFFLQLAVFFDKRVHESDGQTKSTYELAALTSGLLGITGLITTLSDLWRFYAWIFEGAVLLLAIAAIALYGPNEGKIDSSRHSTSSSYPSSVFGHTLLYAQVFVAVNVAILPRKWTAIGARKRIAVFFIFPFIIQLLVTPFTKASVILRDFCIIYLMFASVIQLGKAFVGFIRFLHKLPEALRTSLRLLCNVGWVEFIAYHTERTNLAHVLMIAWFLKFTVKLILFAHDGLLYATVGSLLDCFDSIQDLAGVSIVVGYVANVLLDSVNRFLRQNHGRPEGEQSQDAWNEGVSFFLLGLQTGIVNHEKHDRLMLIGLVLFVTISLFLQSALELTEPALMSLGAMYTGVLTSKHVRALAVCSVILILPGLMIVFLCQMFSFDAWLFVILSSNLVTIVQVMSLLVSYLLFISNVHSETQLKDLDDHVYYINAGSKVFEFLVAVVVLAYTVWATFNGDWSYLGAVIVSFHAYFNVYSRAKEGWRNFLLRRNAVKRLNSLQWATDEQLQNLNDVCCICYDVLEKAKMTKCGHYFHSLCLKKWLYVQDNCPMCHADILPQD